jgi:hypothetical protein
MCPEGETLDYEPLLYQLSYVGASGANIAFTDAGDKRSAWSPAFLPLGLTNKIDDYEGSTKVSPISRNAMRSGVLRSAA